MEDENITLKEYINTRLMPIERQLAEVDADVKELLRSKATLEGKACEIDKKANKSLVSAALLIASLSLIVSIVALFIRFM